MSMVRVSLPIADGSPQWGMVNVFKAGRLVRQYTVTKSDLRALCHMEWQAMCGEGEWIMLDPRPCLRGMAFLNPDGSIVINRGTRRDGRFIKQRFGRLGPDDYCWRDGAIHVCADKVIECAPHPNFPE